MVWLLREFVVPEGRHQKQEEPQSCILEDINRCIWTLGEGEARAASAGTLALEAAAFRQRREACSASLCGHQKCRRHRDSAPGLGVR